MMTGDIGAAMLSTEHAHSQSSGYKNDEKV